MSADPLKTLRDRQLQYQAEPVVLVDPATGEAGAIRLSGSNGEPISAENPLPVDVGGAEFIDAQIDAHIGMDAERYRETNLPMASDENFFTPNTYGVERSAYLAHAYGGFAAQTIVVINNLNQAINVKVQTRIPQVDLSSPASLAAIDILDLSYLGYTLSASGGRLHLSPALSDFALISSSPGPQGPHSFALPELAQPWHSFRIITAVIDPGGSPAISGRINIHTVTWS